LSKRIPRRAAPAVILLTAGAVCFSAALYIPAKAAVAQILLERAWARAEAGEPAPRPWPWADIAPIAKLDVPRLREHSIVLEGVSGAALAFGPGRMPKSAAIGGDGTAILAAHRDTQFRFLKDLVPGDLVIASTVDRRRISFRVIRAEVVRADASGLDPADTGPTGARLALVTCYPFNGVFHSPWRYVVLAERTEGELPTAPKPLP
jgi:sortase A